MNEPTCQWSRTVFAAALGVSLLLGSTAFFPGAQAQDEQALKMPGKRSLLQRVLARPGARIYTDPVDGGAARSRAIAPFSVLYVYARDTITGDDWIRVGRDGAGNVLGWLRADQAIEWRQSLTVAFKDPIEHERVLLFGDRESVKSLADSYDLGYYLLLQSEAEAGKLRADSPVVAIQPRAHVDIARDFYLVPIVSHEDIYLGDEQALLLQVTTVPKEASVPAATEERGYRSGIVFVTDSTISMGPYIDRTRQVIRRIYDAIVKADLKESVSFGLIAYRDNLTAAPGLEYLTTTYATLDEGLDPEGFMQRVAAVVPSSVSSKGFNEDAYAGIKQAIESIDWNDYDARFVVLITDAGPRVGSDRLGATGLSTSGLRQLALDKDISIWAFHLRTPQGERNHGYAEEQYRALSQYPDIGAFYYPVSLGAVDDFGEALEAITSQIVAQVKESAEGKTPARVTDREQSALGQFQEKVDKLGYALRMRYLQRQAGERIPAVFDAWLLDRDFQIPQRKALDVRVLLTRDQLSDLQYVLKKVLDAAEEGVLAPSNLLDELKSLAATISRDPAAVTASTQVTGAGAANLADLGYMREYIEDLPYKGKVMSLSLEEWEDWSAKKQLEFIHDLESKINYYQALHDNTDLWISLDGGPLSGDSVFPISLTQLP